MWWIAAQLVNVGTSYTRVYAIEGDGGVVLVDAHNPGNAPAILDRLERAGIDPDRVTAIVLTHGHPDHAGSATALADLLDVPIVAGALEAEYLASGSVELHPTGSRGRLIQHVVKKSFPPVVIDVPVEDTIDLSVYGVHAIARVVGGHTPGSLVVDLGDGRVLSGDLIRSRLFRHHRPTLHFFQDDPAEAHDALRDQLAAGATTFLPAHGGALAAADVSWWLAERAPRHEARLSAREDAPTRTGEPSHD